MLAAMHIAPRISLAALVLLTITLFSTAAPKSANPPVDGVKSLPPTTKPLAPGDQAKLDAAVSALEKDIVATERELKDKPALLDLLPDVQIYLNALRYPLVYHEAIDVKKIQPALDAVREHVAQGDQLAVRVGD